MKTNFYKARKLYLVFESTLTESISDVFQGRFRFFLQSNVHLFLNVCSLKSFPLYICISYYKWRYVFIPFSTQNRKGQTVVWSFQHPFLLFLFLSTSTDKYPKQHTRRRKKTQLKKKRKKKVKQFPSLENR